TGRVSEASQPQESAAKETGGAATSSVEEKLELFPITQEEKEFILRMREAASNRLSRGKSRKMREETKKQAPKKETQMEKEKKCETPGLEETKEVQSKETKEVAKTETRSAERSESLSDRYVLFPIEDEVAYKFFKLQDASIWHSSEIDLSQDQKDWEKLNVNERHFIETVLAFFADADGVVLEN